MYRSAIIFGLYLSFAIAIGAACSAPAPLETRDDDDSSNGNTGNTPRGGSAGSNVGLGGTNVGQGGTNVGQGGTNVGQGGTLPMQGGTGGSAGRAAGGATTGGTGGTAGHVATGGAAGTAVATGGTGNVAMGGTTAMGGAGTGSAGMTSVSCDTTFSVANNGFVRMPGKGGTCYSGYAFAGGDTKTTTKVNFPGGGTDFSMCMGMLKIDGTVGPATEENSYAGNVYFGFNIAQAGSTKGTVKPGGTSLTVTCTGCSSPPMRVQLVAGSKQWCAPLTSGTAIPYTSFQQECWEGGAMTPYAMEPIDSIQIGIPGGMEDATFNVTLTSVTEQ